VVCSAGPPGVPGAGSISGEGGVPVNHLTPRSLKTGNDTSAERPRRDRSRSWKSAFESCSLRVRGVTGERSSPSSSHASCSWPTSQVNLDRPLGSGAHIPVNHDPPMKLHPEMASRISSPPERQPSGRSLWNLTMPL
jgi:hypothetical protein